MGWFDERAGLDGTVAVVLGGAGGLGAATVADLAANGVRPAVLDRDADAVAKMRVELGPDSLVHHGDARSPDVLAELFSAVDERWGRLDTLVNVVGGSFDAPFTETKPKGWDALLRTNFLNVLHACSLAVPRMRAGGRGGSIVNVTSIEAHRAAPHHAVYSASKAAVEQFARTLAVEVARDGIRVNNVAPDYAPTPGLHLRHQPTGPEAENVRVAIPMGRPGLPSDVSAAVVFLASRLSSYITGTTLHPDGGTFASSGWNNWPEMGWRTRPPHEVLEAFARESAVRDSDK